VNGTGGAAWPNLATGGRVTWRSSGGLMSSTADRSTSSRSRARASTSSSTAPASVNVFAWKQTIRYRLNRAGDRQLNCALHTIVLTRLQQDPATRAYATWRAAEGKTPREIKRCLKRYVARHLARRRGQDPARDQALPEALRRPPPVPPPRNHRTHCGPDLSSSPPEDHRHLLLTDMKPPRERAVDPRVPGRSARAVSPPPRSGSRVCRTPSATAASNPNCAGCRSSR